VGRAGRLEIGIVRIRHGSEIRDVPVGSARGAFERLVTARDGDRVFVWCAGSTFSFERVRGARAAARADHGGDLRSPMPGRVRRISASIGARVSRGDLLLVLEAMKMEHSIRAPEDGVVRRLFVAEGDLVEAEMELVEIG
jgi:3-methylcrotonyl-CoA carboxylase alpha subunit